MYVGSSKAEDPRCGIAQPGPSQSRTMFWDHGMG